MKVLCSETSHKALDWVDIHMKHYLILKEESKLRVFGIMILK